MRYLSTKKVCTKAELSRATLERWIASEKLQFPNVVQVGQFRLRRWTEADVRRVLAYKRLHYRKGRGRKEGGTARRKK
jgi:predicted DNA-binding transcriptional regulator AlpA